MLRIRCLYPVRRPYKVFESSMIAAGAFLCWLFLTVSMTVMASEPGTNLTVELLAEGNYSACIVECKRILISDPKSEIALRLLSAAELKSEMNIAADSPTAGTAKVPVIARSSITGRPVQWLISFYRSQISPAIGQRCSLTPSCSEYGMQSLKKHGVLGVAMIGDRLIREPDVVAEKPAPVRIGNRWFYTDAVSEHDWWMTSSQERETSKP